MDLNEAFAERVGPSGSVAVVGGRTDWDLGGPVSLQARLIEAPAGVVDHQPTEMTVRVGAGTTVADLDATLAGSGQCVALPDRPGATVGGVLAVGRSGIRRLGWGPVRDTVLEIRYVDDGGALVTAGGPMIKNVTGFDLCRLMVGSLGTLGLFAEVVLRTRPLPESEVWLSGRADPIVTLDELPGAVSVLWDGERVWVLLSGLGADVEAQRTIAAALGLARTEVRPDPPGGGRWSIPPALVPDLPARFPGLDFLAEVGVGIIHTRLPAPGRRRDAGTARLHRRVKAQFDPTDRLNPGRDPWGPEPVDDGSGPPGRDD